MALTKKQIKGSPKAIVLLSGGLDSATAAACAKADGFELYGLTVIYGQRHLKEVKAAKAVGQALELKDHFISQVTLGHTGSALLDKGQKVPVDRDIGKEIKSGQIPSTYVPGRNLILLSVATYWAEVVGAEAIYTGFNVVDYSGYPDCSSEFVKKFQAAMNIGTKAGKGHKPPLIVTPLIGLDKAGIIKKGLNLGVPYELTWSCYMGGKKACGRCDSCQLRLKGFEEAGRKDPIEYMPRKSSKNRG